MAAKVDLPDKIGLMPVRRPAPTLRLRRLAGELRRLRNEAGLSREDVARQTEINDATLYRLEAARARPQRRTLLTLLNLYDAPQGVREELLTLSKSSEEKSWLQSFEGDLPQPYTEYIAFEGEAVSLLNFELSFVPGLLQTEGYARAALKAGSPTAADDEIGRLAEARMSRQAALSRDPPLRLWVIIDEAVLHRPVGGQKVMREQLARLAEGAALPNVTLQVLPYSVGGHPGMPGSFALLRFEPPFGDVVYVETQAGDLFLEAETDVARFTAAFEHLRALAAAPEQSVQLIAAIIRDLG